MEIEQSNDGNFSLYIKFVKGEGDPSRIFRSMSGLIDAFSELDQQLIGIFGKDTATEMVLSEVESGSIKSKLRSIVAEIPDDAISNLDVKKLIGHYLLKAKYMILKWLEENDEIISIEQIKEIEGEIIKLAEQTNIKHLPAYYPIEARLLLSQINAISNAIFVLDERDNVRYESEFGNVKISRRAAVNSNLVKDILTREKITTEGERIVKVKKPDYLGKSKWGLKYSGHSIEAAIEDYDWLALFQNNTTVLLPGDSLRVILKEEVSYGHNLEVVQTCYTISQIIEVIHPKYIEQVPLDF